MTDTPSHQIPPVESIFDEIANLRARRDASARNCVTELLKGDMTAAMWFAEDSRGTQADLNDAMRRIKAEILDE